MGRVGEIGEGGGMCGGCEGRDFCVRVGGRKEARGEGVSGWIGVGGVRGGCEKRVWERGIAEKGGHDYVSGRMMGIECYSCLGETSIDDLKCLRELARRQLNNEIYYFSIFGLPD